MKHAPPNISSGLDTDNYDEAPSNLKLEQVHVFVRHGERTPVGIRMTGSPANIPEYWNLCKSSRQFNAAVFPHAEINIKKITERKDGVHVEGDCQPGELTDLGRKSTLNFGLALRKLYIEQLEFLPDLFKDDGIAYFRSTGMPRTIESLQQVVQGLYPTAKTHDGHLPRMLMRHWQDENLMGNMMACARLKELSLGFAEATAKLHNPELSALNSKISKYIGGQPIKVDGKPRASGILDTVRAAQAHGIPVPPEFEDPDVIRPLENAVCSEWFTGYRVSQEFQKLAMGRILDDLQQKMQKKITQKDADPLKIAVMSCHDTSIAGLLATLGTFDDRWPAFTASLTFELFSDTKVASAPKPWWGSVFGSQSSREDQSHYIRLRYQNRSLQLPICAEEGKHLPGLPEFCTLKAFLEKAKSLNPQNWEQECMAIGKKTEGKSTPPPVQL